MEAFMRGARLDARRTELFTLHEGPGGGGGGGGIDASAIRSGIALGGSYTSSRPGLFTLDGLVPDGVATGVLTRRRGTPVSVPVTNNLFLADIPTQPPGPPQLKSITWLGADGAVLKELNVLTIFGRVSSATR